MKKGREDYEMKKEYVYNEDSDDDFNIITKEEKKISLHENSLLNNRQISDSTGKIIKKMKILKNFRFE